MLARSSSSLSITLKLQDRPRNIDGQTDEATTSTWRWSGGGHGFLRYTHSRWLTTTNCVWVVVSGGDGREVKGDRHFMIFRTKNAIQVEKCDLSRMMDNERGISHSFSGLMEFKKALSWLNVICVFDSLWFKDGPDPSFRFSFTLHRRFFQLDFCTLFTCFYNILLHCHFVDVFTIHFITISLTFKRFKWFLCNILHELRAPTPKLNKICECDQCVQAACVRQWCGRGWLIVGLIAFKENKLNLVKKNLDLLNKDWIFSLR